MEDFLPASALFSSSDNGDGKEIRIVPSSAAELPATPATRRVGNVGTFLYSSVFCLFILRLIGLFNSSPANESPSSAPETLEAGERTPASSPETLENGERTPASSYDVFLNHRGPDVKRTLASIIFHWLEQNGFRVFLDEKEFRAGEGLRPTIQQAISSALVHIAILSKRYAESSWCLDELCSMLKTGAKVIPVFYDVQPRQVRWIEKGKGVYVSALAKHQKKYRVPSQKLDEWKTALRQVSDMHVLELNGQRFHGDWGKLVRQIVDDVSEAVAKKLPLASATHPVGLDEAVNDFQSRIQGATQNRNGEPVKIVGIVGIGGSGKTTLATEFYNIQRQRLSFTAASFLSDVRHKAAEHQLQSLGCKLLKDILHSSRKSIESSSLMECKAILENRLRSSALPVLIILDDIDDEKQVEELLNKDVLPSGSLLVLISHEEDALRQSGAELIYEISPLKPEYALQLFCIYAFGKPEPNPGFKDLAEEFCRKCGGRPLFLRVMGAYLGDRGKDDISKWNKELEFIPDGIKKILKFHYHLLSEEEKQIFLDIACFFLGEDKRMAIRLWNKSCRRASTCLQNLERKCLVEVDDENCLKMHDHLRDFAREMAEQESCCRLWHPNQFTNVREQPEGRKEIRGIIAATSESFHDLTDESTFEQMELSRLKFLAINGDCFRNRLESQATNLMWLRWYNFPHTDIPSRLISMQHLTVLHILGGILEVWDVSDIQLPLMELVIQKTRLSYISISEENFPELEHLDLGCNEHLAEVEHLPTTLVSLNLSSCTALRRISPTLHLEKLKFLNINQCRQLEQLPDLGQSSSLETLRALDCPQPQNIPGLQHLPTLRRLVL